MLTKLTPEAVEAFVATAGPESGSTIEVAELRQLGGALSRPVAGGATSHFDGAYLLFALGMAFDPEMSARTTRYTGRLLQALSPWAGGRPYLNFIEHRTDTSRAYSPSTWARLQEVRSRIDPDRLLRANHVI